jgi:hypothetical protein
MDKKKQALLVEYLIVAAILISTSFTPYKLIGMLILILFSQGLL